jgi:hypothetical protein
MARSWRRAPGTAAAAPDCVTRVPGDNGVFGTGRQSGPADGLPRLPVQPAAVPAPPAAEPAAVSADPADAPPGALDQQAIDRVADAVMARLRERRDTERDSAEMPSVDQAIALREQAPELYDLWLRIAKDKAATSSFVERAPYEVPERLAHSGRPRALGALIVVLAFCGYLAWLGGPGPYIAGLIAVLDLGVMFGIFFGLRPERLSEDLAGSRRARRAKR